ncbi:MAG: hypothetical protein ACK4RN_00025 [Pseudorhodobacter sp.]
MCKALTLAAIRDQWHITVYLPKGLRSVVAATSRLASNQPDRKGAIELWRHPADHFRAPWPNLPALMEGIEGEG